MIPLIFQAQYDKDRIPYSDYIVLEFFICVKGNSTYHTWTFAGYQATQNFVA